LEIEKLEKYGPPRGREIVEMAAQFSKSPNERSGRRLNRR